MKKEAARRVKRVTEEDCRKAEWMAKGGATLREISKLIDKDQTTLSRMKKAGYNLKKYNEITAAKNRKKKYAPAEEQELQGQIEMELTTEKPEMSEQRKMMYIQAAQTDKLIVKLDQIYNMTSIILRAVMCK